MCMDMAFYYLQENLVINTVKKIVDAAAKPLINKHGKNIMDTAKKSGIDAAKIASKRVV